MNKKSEGTQAKRRWGDRPSLPLSNEPNEHDIAMAALLGEATAREDERERQRRDNQDHRSRAKHMEDNSHNQHRKHGVGGKRFVEDDDSAERDPSRNKRRRWSDREGAPRGNSHIDAVPAEVHSPTTTTQPKAKADFGLSGALAKDSQTGNVRDGITLKFSEPPEARVPNTRWRLYVFRSRARQEQQSEDDGLIDTYHVSRQSAYLFGRERKVADIPVDHPSLSKQHAVLQYRTLPSKQQQPIGAPAKLQCKPYLMDLESTNGTFINGERLDPARYYELKRGDVITLGASSREYVVLTEQSTKTGI